MADEIRVTLLGHFGLEINRREIELSLRTSQALLAYLILRPQEIFNRELLADLLWPGAEDAKGNLRNSLYHLRNAAGSELVKSHRDGLMLNPDWVIKTDVELLLERDAKQLTLEELMAALEPYSDELLTDFYDDWILVERRRINAIVDRWFAELIGRLEKQNRHGDVIKWAEKWLYTFGVVEPAYRALMLAYANLGNNSQVGKTHQKCISDLKKEFGVAPSQATEDLYKHLTSNSSVDRNSDPGDSNTARSFSPPEENQASPITKKLWLRVGLAAAFITIAFSGFRVYENQWLPAQNSAANDESSRFSSGQYVSSPTVDLKPRFLRVTDQGNLAITTSDGQEYTQISVEGLYVMGASWIQANGHILVWADPRGDVSNTGQGDFYTVDAEGNVIDQLTFTQEVEPKGVPDITDDGTSIVYATGEAVNIYDVATGAVTTVVQPDGGLSWVVRALWSSDENEIVYFRITPACNDCEQTARLMVIDRDGQNERAAYVSEPTRILTLEVDSIGISEDGAWLGFQDLGPKIVSIAEDAKPISTDTEIWFWNPSAYPQWYLDD